MNIKNFLFVSGLIFLLLLSPCNVRKPLQSFFGIPQTEVQNVNKAVVNPNCNVDILEEIASIRPADNAQSLKFLVNYRFISSVTKIVSNLQSQVSENREIWDAPDEVPYYILFKKLKLHV